MKKSIGFACMAAVAIGVIVACSGSSNGGSGSSAPTCQGSTGATGPGSSACNSCLQSHCGSQLSAFQSACGPFVACYQGCQCSDTNCIMQCQSRVDSTCVDGGFPEISCQSQNCPNECNPSVTDAGGGGG